MLFWFLHFGSVLVSQKNTFNKEKKKIAIRINSVMKQDNFILKLYNS